MPEGHTIHRAARLQAQALGDGPVAIHSPQGRFAEGAALLDGARVTSIEAVGKHLFYSWDRRPVLHVHLGLFGKFWTFRELPPPPPSPNTRLAMIGESAVYLSGPTICELLDPIQVEAVKSRLGPDPLAADADPEPFYASLERRSTPIGAVLLDQSAIAGIGNVYRSELLFLCGIHPDRPANDLTEDETTELWSRSVELLRIGERLGRIVTVDPGEVGAARPSDLPKQLRLYVYKRSHRPCRRCGTEIASWESAGRSVWACSSCQPR